MDKESIVLGIILMGVFLLLIIGFVYIIYRASLSMVDIIEKEELRFINWVRRNCTLTNGEWYYLDEPYSSEELLEIYNKQLELDE
jgi:hypothetical protein